MHSVRTIGSISSIAIASVRLRAMAMTIVMLYAAEIVGRLKYSFLTIDLLFAVFIV